MPRARVTLKALIGRINSDGLTLYETFLFTALSDALAKYWQMHSKFISIQNQVWNCIKILLFIINRKASLAVFHWAVKMASSVSMGKCAKTVAIVRRIVAVTSHIASANRAMQVGLWRHWALNLICLKATIAPSNSTVRPHSTQLKKFASRTRVGRMGHASNSAIHSPVIVKKAGGKSTCFILHHFCSISHTSFSLLEHAKFTVKSIKGTQTHIKILLLNSATLKQTAD